MYCSCIEKKGKIIKKKIFQMFFLEKKITFVVHFVFSELLEECMISDQCKSWSCVGFKCIENVINYAYHEKNAANTLALWFLKE